MFDPTKNFNATVTIKSPMGPIKALVTIDPQDENTFCGTAKLMGAATAFEGGLRNGSNFVFDIALKLPFGKATIRVEAAIDESGIIKGEALMPHRKPMAITGNVDA